MSFDVYTDNVCKTAYSKPMRGHDRAFQQGVFHLRKRRDTVTAPIKGVHADTVRDAGYYAEITEVTIKHG